MISCKPDTSVIGEWELKHDLQGQRFNLSLNEDHTGTFTMGYYDYEETMVAEWQFLNNTLTIEFPEKQAKTVVTQVSFDNNTMRWDVHSELEYYWVKE